AEMLRTKRAVVAREEDILLTRGSQMALYLAAQALVAPGDVVAVEQLGYRPAWEAFRLAGARLVSLPVDAGGLRVDELDKLCVRERVRAVVLTPHHQYPMTVTLETCRRMKLLQLAARHGMAVVEDDYDHEFHYEGKPILPLASADHQGVVVYVGTFTKLLAPGIRLGYVVAPQPVVARMAGLRALIDRQGDTVLEAAVAELLRDGELQAHARKARREYQQRRDVLAELLTKELNDRVEFALPPGGMALWVRVSDGVSTELWAKSAHAQGLVFSPGSTYALEGVCPSAVRLGYASLTPDELREAVARLLTTYPYKKS
ncbi:MAG TPA: PLP-dependent aminotransferase family protein, partial [Bryobacteraceae bacterium]|nr:PLP-dependent aminotransferase family protein [Bryobacteraceae bacterium]